MQNIERIDLAGLECAMAADAHLSKYADLICDALVTSSLKDARKCSSVPNDWPLDQQLLAVICNGESQYEFICFQVLQIGPLKNLGTQQEVVVEIVDFAILSITDATSVISHVVHSGTDMPLRYSQTFYFLPSGVEAIEGVGLSDLNSRFHRCVEAITNAVEGVGKLLLEGFQEAST